MKPFKFFVQDVKKLPAEFQLDFDKVKSEAEEIWQSDIVKNFRTESFDNTAWKKRKTEVVPSRALLVLTGNLRREATNVQHKGDLIYVKFYDTKSYAPKHNFGTGGMPRRQFIGKSKQLFRRLDASLQRNRFSKK